jgi:glycosyltransferase involved in cell wall biosynthesis
MKFVIVDSDIRGDHRIQLSMRESSGPVVLVNICTSGSETDRFWAGVASVLLLLRVLIWPVDRYRLLKTRLGARVDSNWAGGLPACFGLLSKAMVASARIRRRMTRASGAVVLHAHDLYCGVAAAIAKGRYGPPLIYDAHELEIHRNRRVGWMRLLVEHWLEQFVLSRSTEIRTVNAAILNVMTEWYKVPNAVRIVYSDFYAHIEVVRPSAQIQPAIVYVGQGVNGRMLEYLDHASVTDLFHVQVFLLGSTLPSHIIAAGWGRGAENYEAALVALSRERRCMMWCCLENRCLSYELATPNKFFQALAIGAPIIASQGTYLAEIVLKYDIGAVFDGSNLSEIQKEVLGRRYEAWVTNVLWFRKKIRSGDLVI